MGRLNATGASRTDYVATYDPKTSRITRLNVANFATQSRGLSLHGMDVVPSSSNPNDLLIYLINHRAPLGNVLASKVGADSVIELFKTTVGGSTMTHIRTFQDESVIITPNDLVGSPDGKSFYFTNDHGARVGLVSIYLTAYISILNNKSEKRTRNVGLRGDIRGLLSC
jgi:arylesterase/paraoxonase